MKILLFDDHKLLGDSLTRALEEFDEIGRCDFISTEREFYSAVKKRDYDIILLDINLKNASNLNGFEILEKLKEKKIPSKIVILSSYDMPMYRKKAFEKGASDFINKSIDMERLVQRLVKVYRNQMPEQDTEKPSLTPREIEILRAMCTGRSRKQLASDLYISERTLYNHIQNIYDKLEVNNSIEAFQKAIKAGYIDPLM